MESDDLVHPGDAAVQALLALTADQVVDTERRDRILDAMLTVPPLTEWPNESLEALRDTCSYIISLARVGREVKRLTQDGE